MTLVKTITLLTSILIAPLAFASDCEQKTDYKSTITCLNNYASKKITKGSKADNYFRQRFSRLAAKYSLSPKDISHTEMAKHFKIVVEERPPIGSSYTSNCFTFGKYWKKYYIKQLKKQIDEAALFLAEIHSRAWGNQVSLLFPIKEVSLCSAKANKGRTSVFSQRSYSISTNLSNIQTADELLKRWDHGNPIRKYDIGISKYIPLGNYFRYLWSGRDKEVALKDKLADYWPILNPIGKLRTTALYTLVAAVKKLRTETAINRKNLNKQPSKIDEMNHVILGIGFTDANRNHFHEISKDSELTNKLYSLWQAKQLNPYNMVNVIEQGIGHNASKSKKLHLVMRDIEAAISITNDKTISVQLLSLIKHSMPVMNFIEKQEEYTNKDRIKIISGKESVEINADLDSMVINKNKTRSWIAIDLIDDVLVSIQIPTISPRAYRRITLYQALQNIVLPGQKLYIRP